MKQPIKSNSVASGNMSQCWTSSLYDHLDHCFVVFNTPDVKTGRLREHNQHCLDHQSFHGFSFSFEICTGLTVLDCSDTCFREELRRSDPINETWVYRPTSIFASKEMISDSVELCETDVCFLHIHN